jgi:integrase
MICIMPKKKKVSFRYVWETHLQPSLLDAKCTPKHIQEMDLYLTRWESFWKTKAKKSPKIQACSREDLEKWRRHLMDLDKYKPRSINKHLGAIRSILRSAAKHALLKRRPMLEQLPDTTLDPARKIYLRDEQIDALMSKTDSLVWPRKSFSGVEPADWWRCAMVLYRTYGFRPQELLAYDPKKTPITWANISFAIESPNPSSEQTNQFGWLHYVPPKTKRKKPHPLYLPLTRHARAALDIIAVTRVADDSPLFPMPASQQGFLKQWYAWFEDAGVKPKIDGARFKPYCLRKTCATHMSAHKTGLATAICRWGSSGEAGVASEHYIGADNIIRFLLDAPMPKSFDALLTAL